MAVNRIAILAVCKLPFLELVTGFEPTTRGLRYRCSAVEPHQHIYKNILLLYFYIFNKKLLYFAACVKTILNYIAITFAER